MMQSGPEELAVHGERGIDVFQRIADEGQRRARFRCVASIDPASGQLEDFDPQARREADRLLAMAAQVQGDALLARPFSLSDPGTWPRAAQSDGDPMRLFLYHEFFRAWQVADMAAHRLIARLDTDPGALPLPPDRVVQAVTPIFDFNRLALGLRAARLVQPVLATRIAHPDWREPKGSATGYALRMLGDLCLRTDDPALAQRCYETAVAAGDNPFRRRKAIEAAHAAGDTAARDAHIAAFGQKWALPGDLSALQQPEGSAP